MATRLVDISSLDRENVFKRVRREIEEIFHSLIEKVNERREVLLRQLNQWEEEFNRTRASCIQSLEEIKRERTEMEELLSKLKMNQVRTSMEKGIADLNAVISEKEKKLYYQVRFVCDKNDLELKISKFGSLSKETGNVLVRNYTQLSKPVKVFGTFGEGKREFSGPKGVVIDNNNQRIFIVDCYNSRIQVWSMEGEYVSEFGKDVLHWPWEIILCGNFIYISDTFKHLLSKWCMNTFTFVKKSKTSLGSAPGQLNTPTGLDIDKEELFVVEHNNRRISVFDLLNLEFKRIMTDNAIADSSCLRVRNNTIYIVEATGVIKLFSKTDVLLKTIPKLPVFSNPIYYSNFDILNNFFILDPDKHRLCILSPEGDLIHSVSFSKYGLYQPFGVDIGKCGTIVMSFSEGSSAVALF